MPKTAAPEATPQTKTPQENPPAKRKYTLKFEPVGNFNETELFLKGIVRGKMWIAEKLTVQMKSLTGKDVDEVNDEVKVEDGMSQTAYNTLITYHNLSHAIEAINGESFTGTTAEKISKFKEMAAPILTRLTLAYLEFSDRVDEIFHGKGVGETAKKS